MQCREYSFQVACTAETCVLRAFESCVSGGCLAVRGTMLSLRDGRQSSLFIARQFAFNVRRVVHSQSDV